MLSRVGHVIDAAITGLIIEPWMGSGVGGASVDGLDRGWYIVSYSRVLVRVGKLM